MSLFEDLVPLLPFSQLGNKARNFSEALVDQVSKSMSATPCGGVQEVTACRDESEALWLKMVAVVAILVAGIVGVGIPLVGRKRRLRTDSGLFVFAKAFAAGVILATGFVHMLPDGESALTDPCLPSSPWSDFPFSGFVAMLAALATLVLDFLATQFYERKHRTEEEAGKPSASVVAEHDHNGIGIVVEGSPAFLEGERSSGGDDDKDRMHIVGMHAHAAEHRHSHVSREGHAGRTHSDEEKGESSSSSSHVRHVVVSQILELGIVSHSVIIGLSLGVSHSPCTIRPLIGALSFHQFFEGFALGGCISQAQFRNMAATLMACFFAVTTPAGIVAGAGLASFYNPNSPRALVVEGILDSVSAGILIYMALVDLIAADFLSRNMSCNVRLQVASYLALFLGAASMSSLAIWS